ncbi:MAG: XRE family transcriptional regulator [Candidatus Obscuribacterales bacterium]|nr:XRE family transcriptional regulator [Candidatus Obscuribacterales bacterium]
MISYKDYKKKLTPEQQAKVDELARQLIAEEKSLREIRKARECSQAELAKKLGMNQGDLSKFERRTDVYLSTVRHYVEALGGTLDLIATFPETGSVKIANFGNALVLDEDDSQASATV